MKDVKTTLTALALIGSFAVAGAAAAEEHQVKMLNKSDDGEMMVFEPAYLKVAPGDTVTFVPTDKSHNSEAVAGMIPEGAEAWKGKLNQEVAVTFEQPGIYGFKCMPHYGMGMVGLIQVGDEAPNLDEALAVKHPGRANARMAALLDDVQTTTADAGADPVAIAGAPAAQ
jgi:pseudoazurin